VSYEPYLVGIAIGCLSTTAMARLLMWPYVRSLTATELADRVNDARYRLYWAGRITRGESNALVAVQQSLWRYDGDKALEDRIQANTAYLGNRERFSYADERMVAEEKAAHE